MFRRIVLLALLALAVVPAVATHASSRRTPTPKPPKYDVRGTWTLSGTNGAQTGDLRITWLSKKTGRLTGTSYGGRFKVTGHLNGTAISITHSAGSYSSTDVGTVTGKGGKMGGTFHDNSGLTGDWSGVKVKGLSHPRKQH